MHFYLEKELIFTLFYNISEFLRLKKNKWAYSQNVYENIKILLQFQTCYFFGTKQNLWARL